MERTLDMNTFTARAVTGASPDLVAALTEIHRKSFPPNMQFADAPRYFEEALDDERNLNILLQDQTGTVLGYLLAIPQSLVFEELRQWDPEMQDDPERLYLEMIQVLPEQRGSKLGLRLIQRVCAEAEKRNIFNLSMHARTTTGWSEYLRRIFAEVRFLRQLENWYGFCEPFDYLEATTTLRTTVNTGESLLAATAGAVA
jgi:ribosomal protein S18 acetylase RimI-like enzyme